MIPVDSAPPPGVWRDAGPVDPGWAPPTAQGVPPAPTTPTQPRQRRLPGWAITLGVLLVAALVVGAIWGAGGFARRTDLLRPTAPGAEIATGPYVLVFTGVTAQRKKDFDDSLYWEVKAVGTGRTTGSVSIAPDAEEMYATKDDTSGEVEVATGDEMGNTDGIGRHHFAPGAGPVPYAVTFRYRAGYVPGPTLRMVVATLQYTDDSLLKDGQKTWNNGTYSYVLRLPVRVLPPATT